MQDITQAEAIAELREMRTDAWTDARQMQALDMAIKALEQEPCNDVISRHAVLKIIDVWYENNRDTENIEDLIILITYMASVNPQEPKTGHWIVKEGKEQGYDIAGIKTWYIQIMCDKCGFIKTAIEGHAGQYHFCPNCGARMVEPQESEDKE